MGPNLTPTPADHVGPGTAERIATLAAANVGIQSKDGVSILVMPNGYQKVDLTRDFEKARLQPDRKRGTATLNSIDSLIEYAQDQARTASGYAYADADSRTIVMVFNDYKGEIPGWRDHRAEFKAELTPEAALWMKHDGKGNAFTQEAFAEFIEDNIADLQGEEAKNLLTVATTIAATTGINFSSAKRLQNGETQLVFNEQINATAGADGRMKIPQTFDLGLRLFKGDKTGYVMRARLKYRLVNPGIKFWYELERPERSLEDAFTGYVERVKESGYTVLLGKPGPA